MQAAHAADVDVVSLLCLGDWGQAGAGRSSARWVTTVIVLLAALSWFLGGSNLPVGGGREVVREWTHAEKRGPGWNEPSSWDLDLLVPGTFAGPLYPGLLATSSGGFWYPCLFHHPVATSTLACGTHSYLLNAPPLTCFSYFLCVWNML